MKKSCLIIGLFFYVFTSCSFKEKFENNISRQSQFLEKYKDSLESVDKSIKPLDWAQAKKLLISNNISLQRSRRRAVSVIENRENYWRTYIPGLRANVSLSQALSELDSISLDTVNLSSFLTLRVPNPLTLSGEVQALNLAQFTAQRSYQLEERRQVRRLYQHFLSYSSIEREMRVPSKPIESLDTAGEITKQIQRDEQNRKSRLKTVKQLESISLDIAELLQTPNVLWQPQIKDLPHLGYRDRKVSLLEDKGYARLALELLAAELESSRLRLTTTKLQQFPTFNLSASSPQVFNSNTESDFDLDTISLFGGLSDGIDFEQNFGERVKFSKEDYVYALIQAKREVRSDLKTLKEAEQRLHTLYNDLKVLEESRKILQNIIRKSSSIKTLKQNLDQLNKIENQINALDRQLTYQELEFWIWDDKKWKE